MEIAKSIVRVEDSSNNYNEEFAYGVTVNNLYYYMIEVYKYEAYEDGNYYPASIIVQRWKLLKNGEKDSNNNLTLFFKRSSKTYQDFVNWVHNPWPENEYEEVMKEARESIEEDIKKII